MGQNFLHFSAIHPLYYAFLMFTASSSTCNSLKNIIILFYNELLCFSIIHCYLNFYAKIREIHVCWCVFTTCEWGQGSNCEHYAGQWISKLLTLLLQHVWVKHWDTESLDSPECRQQTDCSVGIDWTPATRLAGSKSAHTCSERLF